MPSWKDNLQPASFSGVQFHVRESERQGGRRASVHEYPLRERPFVEELGALARRFSVDGYVIGDDYPARRTALIDALESASPEYPRAAGRTLVLPTTGSVKVLCLSFSFREATDEGRIARFHAEFVEVGEEIEPLVGTNPAGAADAAAEALDGLAATAMADESQASGVVEEARTALATPVLEATHRLRRLDVFSGATRDVRALEDALTFLEATIGELVASPAVLAATCQIALTHVVGSAPTPRAALEAYRTLFDLEPLASISGASQAAIASRNSAAVVSMLRTAAAGGAVRAAARVDWETLEDAQATRAELAALLDELEADAAAEVLGGLAALRAVLSTSVPPPEKDLPSLRTLELARTLPAVVVAYTLYQDPTRAGEVAARNAVRNPLRVPGSHPLLVLSS